MADPTSDDADGAVGEFSAAVEEVGTDLVGRDGGWFDRLVDAGLVLAGAVIAVVAVAVTFNVLSRQFLGRSYTWVFEYSEFGVLFLVFLAVAGVARSDGHVRMEIADEVLGPRLLRRLSAVTEIMSTLIALLLAAVGVWITYRNYRAGTTLGLLSTPRWMVLAIVPVGSLALVVVQMRAVRRRLREVSAIGRGD